MFFAGKGAADFFGNNFVLVRGDYFTLIKTPSVVLGEKVDPAELAAGDIVIYRTADNSKNIAEIIEAVEFNLNSSDEADESDSSNTIICFTLAFEPGEEFEDLETDIISKVTRQSRIFGYIVSFAVSPAGVLVIAVIPCVCIVLLEVFKPFFRKKSDAKEITPVKKQEEVPTFIPDIEPEANEHKESEELEDSQDFEHELKEVETEKEKKLLPSAAALRAYKETLDVTQTQEIREIREVKAPQLFVSSSPSPPTLPSASPLTPPTPPPAPVKKKPLSSVKLAEVIATINSQKEPEDSITELNAAEKNERINQAMTAFKGKFPKDSE